MPSIESLTTFSGLMAFFATLALLSGRLTVGATLLVIAGSAGIGIFWDRWSRDAGPHVQVQALFSGHPPTGDQLVLLATHVPLLLTGLVVLAVTNYRRGRQQT